MTALPAHLQKYIVMQNYEKYTPLDHAVWRYVLRQLKHFLKVHAHSCYLDGLEKTGIDVEKIPSIESISKKLEKFGWRALPVSGFIPPAAFMELQSLGVLPIASDMRSIDHLLYTPAPDIVHEAAGHAPILINDEYASYLRQYAQIAKKAIISKQDLQQYEAIRILSDLKENPSSTAAEIKNAENKLSEVSSSISFISEAAELSRMNWWTAEYGLIGPMENPKIFGAGLLSSVSEAKWCLSQRVRKIPLTVDCIKQAYDITEPQPQLFVAHDFQNLVDVLNHMAETMAYKIGGAKGLDKAINAESVNTAELNSGLQISGVIAKYILDDSNSVAYLQFNGPTQISYRDQQIVGHGKSYHAEGYGTPIGEIVGTAIDQLKIGSQCTLTYKSGVQISGTLKHVATISTTAKMLTFSDATTIYKDRILFKPEWGLYDVTVGTKVTSVFGGPADRISYGDTDDFVAAKVSVPNYSESQKKLFSFYQRARDLRQAKNQITFDNLLSESKKTVPAEWLLFIELLEISHSQNLAEDSRLEVLRHLEFLKSNYSDKAELINNGLSLAYEIH